MFEPMVDLFRISRKCVLNRATCIFGSFLLTASKAFSFFPSSEVGLDELKASVWKDLAVVYYKYEDSYQKRAFREVLTNISEKMERGSWDSIYRKLHRVENEHLSGYR